MAARVRKSAEVRREELLDVAASLFTAKGFQATSMEDVVAASGMSKGGVYHYFRRTEDMLYALMQRGNRYRMEALAEALVAYPRSAGIAFLADGIIDKMLAQNGFIPIYVMFLQEAQRSPRLAALARELERDMAASLAEAPEALRAVVAPALDDPFILGLINTFLLGCETLDVRTVFEEHRDYLKVMIMAYLQEKIMKGYST